MTDPFDALRAPAEPVDPDPAFAAALRARIERALTLPRGVTVTTTVETSTVETPAVARGAAIPYLAVPVGTGREALDWYAEVLGARLAGEPIMMPDGRVGHAELALAGGALYLAEAFPEIGFVAPTPTGSSVSLSLQVPDVAATLRRAVDRGARMQRDLYDGYGSRNGAIVDPFGHRWLLHTPLSELPETRQPGAIGYAWLTVPDPDRAARFYADVLGWEYEPGETPGGRNVVGQSMSMGIGRGEPGWHFSYGVADVAAAVDRVRAAGGSSSDVETRPYGPAARCVDDQGVVFALHQGGPGAPPDTGARPGDLAYLSMSVVDSAKARAFYAAVLGWTFSAGRVEDGWGVERVEPMIGLQGGHAEYAAAPMWRVDDVAAAVERVRAAGGTAGEPQRQPYGTTAECTDDQGGRFYLGT